jgi:hypothetical protein|tara:strand:+ start:197 stop:469 length:273 start_codon:yes stop_codon:yes gene_type:complete
MKITKKQLSQIVKEEKARINENPLTKPDAEWERRLMLRDLNNDKPYATRVTVSSGVVTIEFSNSFTLHLDSVDASDLGHDLVNASDYAFD